MALEVQWSWLVAGYLALAGTGAGSYLAAAFADIFKHDTYRAIVKPGFYISTPTIILGSIFLIADLGRPDRFVNVFNHPGTSILSLGAYLLAIFAPLSIITVASWIFIPKARMAIRLIEAVGSIFAFAVAIYIGLLLGAAIARPFWSTPVLPWLLFVSSLSMGLAAAHLYVLPSARTETITQTLRGLYRDNRILVAIEVLALAAFFATAPDARSVLEVLRGTLSPAFYGGVGLLGIVLPLGIEWQAMRISERSWRNARNLLILSSSLLIIAGVSLRYVILWAGQLA